MQQQDDLDPAVRRFIESAVDRGQVWGLLDEEGWALTPAADDETVMVLPLWSDEDDASAAATDAWSDYRTESIAVDELLEHWLPGLEADGHRVGLDWTPDLEGVEVPPLELQLDLETAISALDPDPD
ncbi:DUF2750 domain-containing protein [Methylonatrum kenyense]|uniref:DUF2750 domain-containing protein n=1 Tax=Methylonatrum kenyense TaxID=455253 RepID=UPI0020BF206E|nr:DUF2750 domain-containing protein [Methylonatrum kenyense]MCK8515605.1 DUF2750 domain-containing protein [Methylonatrum kenyense]